MATFPKIAIRDFFRLIGAVIFCIFYVPHLLLFFVKRESIIPDLKEQKKYLININLPDWLACLYLLHNDSYFRSFFYYRIGPAFTMLIGWWRPGDRYFKISTNTTIGKGFHFFHPYATVINAESIGDNFSCLQLTTLGDKKGQKPRIGDNVRLGANVTIIGGVKIGDNVEIGAGSVVVKDIPANSIAVGNPAKVIKTIPPA